MILVVDGQILWQAKNSGFGNTFPAIASAIDAISSVSTRTSSRAPITADGRSIRPCAFCDSQNPCRLLASFVAVAE